MHKITFSDQAPPFTPMQWWGSSGSQDEHVNTGNINQFDWVEEHPKSGGFHKSQQTMDQASGKEKEFVFQSTFSAGENKNSFKENNMYNHQTNSFPQFPPSQQKGFVELGLSQPMVYANYPLGNPCHGVFATFGTPPTGRVMLPFSLTTEDGPIYVNPKQYHGILRRRKMRAKEGLKYKSSREKPYLHESRHRHACRRPRGVGGRFLNTKTLNNNQNNNHQEAKKTPDQIPYHSSDSSTSEVLQSESLNLNSSKEVSNNKTSTNHCTSEVSSIYYNKELDCFNMNPARPFSFHPLANLAGSGQRQAQSSTWVTATDECCDYFKL